MRYMTGISCDDDTEDMQEVDRALRDCAHKFPAVAGLLLEEGLKGAISKYPKSRLLVVRRKRGQLYGFTWYSRGIDKCRVHAVWMKKGKRKIGLRREMLEEVQKFVGKNTKMEVPVKKRNPKPTVQ